MTFDERTSPQPINPSFSGHQTFPFRYTWLKKGVDAVAADPAIFLSKDASVTLGVGKNMVTSIRHWCRVSGLIEEDKGTRDRRGQFATTPLGEAIFDDKGGCDPYLDDPATLWLIHYQIATNTDQATAWYWAFNILRGNQFTPSIFKREVYKWAREQKPSMRDVSDNTLHRDVNCFIRTYCQSRHSNSAIVTEKRFDHRFGEVPTVQADLYSDSTSAIVTEKRFDHRFGEVPTVQADLYSDSTVVEETFDCPLVELNLIAELPDSDSYEFQRGDKETLPIEVVAWTLDLFWENKNKNNLFRSESLPFSDLMYAPSSPGRVFRLDEDTMTLYLEQLEQLTDGAFQYDETAGLKQLYRHKDLNRMELLERYYG